MSDKHVYANFDSQAKNALNQRTFGLGWKDMSVILQIIDGLYEDGELAPAEETEDWKLSFDIGLEELEMIAQEAVETRGRYASTEAHRPLADALRKAGL